MTSSRDTSEALKQDDFCWYMQLMLISSFGILYEGGEPIFYARHPDMVKRITIRDFECFMDFG